MGERVSVPTGKPVGRPSVYSDQLADKICELLVEGNSLNAICKLDGMPQISTVFRWLRTKPEFATSYARARDEQAETHWDEIIQIADDGTNDWIEKLEGDKPVGYILNGEAVQRSKLRVHARMWVAARMKPRKYGSGVESQAANPQNDNDFTVRNALSPGVK